MDVSDPALYEAHSFHPLFARLRREDPVHYCEDSAFGPYWAITRYHDILTVDMDHQRFSSALGGISIFDTRVGRNSSFINMDPPEHRQHRRSVTPVFSTENLAALSNEIEARVAAILDRVPVNTPFDWVTTVANELPLQMLSTLFGVPEDDRYHMLYWTNAQVALFGGQARDDAEASKHPSFSDYFLRLREQRSGARQPASDLVSHLVHGQTDLSDEMYLNHLRLLVVGANDTTRTSIAGGLQAVIEQARYDDLRSAPELLDTAVSEMIRFVTPVVHQRRTAVQDTELAGKSIRAGDKVVMFYVSGNRDNAAFTDADSLVFERTSPRSLSFGSGIHHCIGFRLAQMQMRHMWAGMLARFSGFELAGEAVRSRSNFVHGYLSLPVIARI